MKHWLTLLTLLFLSNLLHSQETDLPSAAKLYPQAIRNYDQNMIRNIPVLKLPESRRNLVLPSSVDNSVYKYFPNLVQQRGFSCQQVTGVSYTFAYEMNRLRDIDSKDWYNTYPAPFTWNYMNDADLVKGVSFFYSWDVLKRQGHPIQTDYMDLYQIGILEWLSGYDHYYAGMKNRLKSVFSIPVNTEEGILTLKHYLYDHMDGSPTGGIVTFGASGQHIDNMVTIPAGLPEAGKHLQTGFYPYATHGMTIVGYNDSIRYDINGDGRFTNDVDLNGDGKIDPRDREWGAWRMANSYGNWWEDGGFLWIMYRAMALDYDEGLPWSGRCGIWNGSVFGVVPDTAYQPLLTMKVSLQHSLRGMISIKAGISQDPGAALPEHVLDLPVWNYQGNFYPTNVLHSGLDMMEVGFDITRLLSYVEDGRPCRLFFIIDENDPYKAGIGKIGSVSFISYSNGMSEIPVEETNVEVKDNAPVILSSAWNASFGKVNITTGGLPAAPTGTLYSQLNATGGKTPYQWNLLHDMQKTKTDSAFPEITTYEVFMQSQAIPYAKIVLPFSFPFYGKTYDTVYMNGYGFITFRPDELPYFYVVDAQEMMRNNQLIAPMFPEKYIAGNMPVRMWYESGQESATFRWQTTATGNSVNFGLRIYPDGRFEFLYGNCANQMKPYTTWSGFSSGDGIDFDVWNQWKLEELSGKSFLFKPRPLPAIATLTETGMLHVSGASSGQIYDLHIRMTDACQISSEKTFSLTSSLDIQTAGEVKIVKGRATTIDLRLENKGTAATGNIALKLDPRPDFTISDSTEAIQNLAPGEVITLQNAFSILTDSTFDDLEKIPFTIHATSELKQWTKNLGLSYAAPRAEVSQTIFEDGADQIPEPGEVGNIIIELKNTGSCNIDHPVITLQPQDTLMTLLSQPEIFRDSLPAHDTLLLTFSAMASRLAGKTDIARLVLTVHDSTGLLLSFPFRFYLGKNAVALIDLSSNYSSSNAMYTALDELGVEKDFYKKIPEGLGDYKAVFVVVGMQNTDSLVPAEENILASYLQSGGKMYTEQLNNWQKASSLKPFLHLVTDTVYGFDINQIQGVNNTFTSQMSFDYSASQNSAAFEFLPVAPAYPVFFTSSHALQVAYPGEDYQSIGSMVSFGALADTTPPSTRKDLMEKYLEFFGMKESGVRCFFHSEKNIITRGDSIRFYDDSFDSITLRSWSFPGGIPSVSSEMNPVVVYPEAGNFNVSLMVKNPQDSAVLIKKEYIHVKNYTGLEHAPDVTFFTLYPNPASDKFFIDCRKNPKFPVSVRIFDMKGNKIREFTEKTDLIEISTSGMGKGMFLVLVHSGSDFQTGKIIIN